MPYQVTEQLQAIIRFNLVTGNLDQLSAFYRDVLRLVPSGAEHSIAREEMSLLGLPGSGRRQMFAVGDQVLAIDQFDAPGCPYPAESDAASLWFQHLALSVFDLSAAYARLHDASAISAGGPQTLPASSGGVQAFKFRDPDGHPLEFLEKPNKPETAARNPSAWNAWIRGIDHSAISVSDVGASSAFYRGRGLRLGKPTLNHGPEQERLDGLTGVEVEVVPMIPSDPVPHLELLGYRTPCGRQGRRRQINDIASTRIVWRGSQDALMRDPDGHLHQIHREACHA